MSTLHFRFIQKEDNSKIAAIIRCALEEYGEAKPGTVYTDPTTDALFEVFSTAQKGAYFVAEKENEVVGGAGLFPTIGLPKGYAELVKIYLDKKWRGLGIGQKLLEKTIEEAIKQGFTHLYLESFPTLTEAIHLYHRNGFIPIDKPLGNSGHFACTVWMVKELNS